MLLLSLFYILTLLELIKTLLLPRGLLWIFRLSFELYMVVLDQLPACFFITPKFEKRLTGIFGGERPVFIHTNSSARCGTAIQEGPCLNQSKTWALPAFAFCSAAAEVNDSGVRAFASDRGAEQSR